MCEKSGLVTLRHPDITISDALYAGEQIAQRLRSLEDSISPFGLRTHFYSKIRVKEHESIREKVKRIQQGNDEEPAKPLYSFRDLTDIIGFRIVTLYDDELPLIVKHIVNLVKAGQTMAQPLFKRGLIWESFHGAYFYKRSAEEGDVYRDCHKTLSDLINVDCSSDGIDPSSFLSKSIQLVRQPQPYSSAHILFNAIGYTRKFRVFRESSG